MTCVRSYIRILFEFVYYLVVQLIEGLMPTMPSVEMVLILFVTTNWRLSHPSRRAIVPGSITLT